MARLNSPPEKYGTFDNICVYHMYNDDFMRSASSLTGERVKTDPAFKNTMLFAQRMAAAARLAGAVYNMLPPYRRLHPYYRVLTGKAMRLLKEGKTEGEVVVELLTFIRLPKRIRKPRKKSTAAIVIKLNERKRKENPPIQQPRSVSPPPVVHLQCVDSVWIVRLRSIDSA